MDETRQAIALRYDPLRGDAPVVTAKGTALLAQRIETMARSAELPIHRDASLAAILMKLELDAPIPPALFAAVAEILAHLFTVDARLRRLAATSRPA